MFDYATLRIIWWGLLGLLLIVFAITDGFDLGVATLLPFVARNNDERRLALNSIGAVWEGNQIWLILSAGVIFAAWPIVYAVFFSGFYFAMFLLLFALILRPVGFKYRGKVNHALWRNLWDTSLCLGSFLTSFLLGVALGNIVQGVPFYFDQELRPFYTGGFLDLLNPFAFLCGFATVALFTLHGAIYLSIKVDGPIQKRAIYYGQCCAALFLILFVAGGIWSLYLMSGYHFKYVHFTEAIELKRVLIPGVVLEEGPSNPLYQLAERSADWLNNYRLYPSLWVFPGIGFISVLLAWFCLRWRQHRIAWIMSAIGICTALMSVGFTLFPFILPSSTHPNMSLTIWDASASAKTLWLMLLASIVLIPIMIAYSSWVYYVLRGKITVETMKKNQSSY